MTARRHLFTGAELAMMAVFGIAIALLLTHLAGPLGYHAGAAAASSLSGPADALHDPLTAPGGALDDLLAARQHGGWILLVLAVSVMLARSARRLPWGIGAWLSTDRHAMGVAVWSTAALAAFDALAAGGSLSTVVYAVIGGLLSMAHPGTPGVVLTRDPQAGRTRPAVMLALAAAGIGGALLIGSCSASARQREAAAIGAGVSCELGVVAAQVPSLVPLATAAIQHLISPTGDVDTSALHGLIDGLVGAAERCAVATVIAGLATPAPKPGVAVQGLAAVDMHDTGAQLVVALGGARQRWGGPWTGRIVTSAGGL